MSHATDRFHRLLTAPGCTNIAPVFDPLSARIAEMLDWKAAKLAGSVGKAVNLAVPEGPALSNITDLAEFARRITSNTEIPLIVDADDGGDDPLSVLRTVRELEAAGVVAIEIEDHPLSATQLADPAERARALAVNAGRLDAAVAAKRKSDTVIFGRTTVLAKYPLELALEWLAAYAAAGVEVIMLSGGGPAGLSANPRDDVEAVQKTVNRPLCVSGMSREMIDDHAWLAANRVHLRNNNQSPYRMAVKAIHDALVALKTGFADDLKDVWASSDLLAEISHTRHYLEWERAHAFADTRSTVTTH